MIYEFFVFASFWWWFLFGAFFLLEVLFVESDKPSAATLTMIIFAVMIVLFGDVSFTWIRDNPGTIVAVIVGWFLAGTVWSVVKWYFFCLNIRDKYLAWSADQSTPPSASDVRYWAAKQDLIEFPPQAIQQKEQIITWMVYWPFSATWTLLNDPVRRLFNMIYRKISKALQEISDKVFKGINPPNDK